jgi:thiol-disulfide isomerase/thioredoxin
VGSTAPSVQLPQLAGGEFNLADHAGKNVVMLDFWATWCGPCVAELPLLVDVAGEYQSKGVVLCAVNVREDPNDIRKFLSQQRLAVNVGLDSGEVAGQYGVEGIPCLVLIDRDGIVQSVHVGYDPNIKNVLRKELNTLLDGKSLAAANGSKTSPSKPQNR